MQEISDYFQSNQDEHLTITYCKPSENLESKLGQWRVWIQDDTVVEPQTSYAWYTYQRLLFKALLSPNLEKILKKTDKYYSKDNQFPPDIVKLLRLYDSLEIVKPDHIIEFGCGTSSAIINEYISSGVSCRADTYDLNEEWLKCTNSKITKFDSSAKKNHSFHIYSENVPESEEALQANYRNAEKLFIYLDAKMQKDSLIQGLEMLINYSDFLPQKWYLLIDSRRQAIKSLPELAKRLDKTLKVISNYRPIPNLNNHKLQQYESKKNIIARRISIMDAFYINYNYTFVTPEEES